MLGFAAPGPGTAHRVERRAFAIPCALRAQADGRGHRRRRAGPAGQPPGRVGPFVYPRCHRPPVQAPGRGPPRDLRRRPGRRSHHGAAGGHRTPGSRVARAGPPCGGRPRARRCPRSPATPRPRLPRAAELNELRHARRPPARPGGRRLAATDPTPRCVRRRFAAWLLVRVDTSPLSAIAGRWAQRCKRRLLGTHEDPATGGRAVPGRTAPLPGHGRRGRPGRRRAAAGHVADRRSRAKQPSTPPREDGASRRRPRGQQVLWSVATDGRAVAASPSTTAPTPSSRPACSMCWRPRAREATFFVIGEQIDQGPGHSCGGCWPRVTSSATTPGATTAPRCSPPSRPAPRSTGAAEAMQP